MQNELHRFSGKTRHSRECPKQAYAYGTDKLFRKMQTPSEVIVRYLEQEASYEVHCQRACRERRCGHDEADSIPEGGTDKTQHRYEGVLPGYLFHDGAFAFEKGDEYCHGGGMLLQVPIISCLKTSGTERRMRMLFFHRAAHLLSGR